MRPQFFSLIPLSRATLTTARAAPRSAQIVRRTYIASGSRNMSAPSSPGGRSAVRIPGPVETSIQQKIIQEFNPVLLRVYNDSSKHSHHAPMRAQGGGNGETHFAVHLVSASFKGKTTIARHRMVNTLLKEEFDERGLHALSLRLKTPEEWEKEGGGEMRQ
ncbi:hypothetical protein L202_03393 [Cryptococcus amylolentus CBS 6039]|uniref:BolA protein n=2 Tax=Cryptococcus amylolentus TaxID=104669 RepID=A0A1E3HSS5_9TREE|nr:hypothetical protein L202_03393 [Cryptococcus amylolentus CBS 6039]ODN79400.1 hypothetical protein L202_03393 [Cryptococcus amylolentus CBS 6039]